MTLKLNRRTLLTGFVAGLIGLLGGCHAFRSGRTVTLDAMRLGCLFAQPESAAALGRIYLDSVPAEAHPEKLVALIDTGLAPTLGPVSEATDEALRAALAHRIRADFSGGDVVPVGGWMLSVTEARLCALVSMGQACEPADST